MVKKMSKKYIIDIKDFMEFYIGKKYDGNFKLTHSEMSMYLNFNMGGGYKLNRIPFRNIKNEDILKGSVLCVKDETGQIIAYRNPRVLSTKSLLNELKEKGSIVKTMRVRRSYLRSLGYIELPSGDIVSENDLEENQERCMDNRTRKLINRDGYKMRGAF